VRVRVLAPSIDALFFHLRVADVWFCVQPFLGSAVSYHSGELSFFSQLMSVWGMYPLVLIGLPHANLLAYWLSGTFFSVLDSAVYPDAFHYDWIGCIYAQLPLLKTLDSK
jgi:hypothetical protein